MITTTISIICILAGVYLGFSGFYIVVTGPWTTVSMVNTLFYLVLPVQVGTFILGGYLVYIGFGTLAER